MASSLCACPALFFKIIILCVCSELLQRPFPALAECLKPISPRDVLDSFLSPRAGAHQPPAQHTRAHFTLARPPPRPAPLPPSLELPPYTICRKFTSQALPQSHLQGNLGKLRIPLDTFCLLGLQSLCPPRTQTCALSAGGSFGAERNSRLKSTFAPPTAPHPALQLNLFYGDSKFSWP